MTAWLTFRALFDCWGHPNARIRRCAWDLLSATVEVGAAHIALVAAKINLAFVKAVR